ncbi:Gx transporter family protein [Desulfitibacter alkalitolerans]|uniref:Gx transporter family protein n=1 Tax=Desulfitibacter alkalitolerans TaxID=264641 RepID=UPI00048154B6|nr:Gx transporter family protein [Desulfitibacter alkalitolerans]
MKISNISLISILAAMAVTLSVLESMFIPSIIPGAKIGLANVVTVVAVYLLSFRNVLGIVIIRTLVSSLFLGTFLSIGYFMSVTGGLASAFVVYILYKYIKNVTPIFLCIIGALVHNITQLVVAYSLIGYGIMYLLPYLLLFAIPAGWCTGKIASTVIFNLSVVKN